MVKGEDGLRTVALIVLAGRSEKNFIRFMDSLIRQENKPDKLVIVYDVEYTDIRLHNIFSKETSNLPIIELYYKGNVKQPAMRNLALKYITEDYVWFVDDDVELDNNSCKKVREIVNKNDCKLTGVACIAGNICDVNVSRQKKLRVPVFLSIHRGATGYYDWDFSDYNRNSFKWITISDEEYPVVPFAQGTNMIFDRLSLERIGGFNELLGVGYASYEDSEPSMALKGLNLYTIYDPYIKLTHYKMPRMGGKKRTDNDYKYEYTLARNYAIALLINSYPSKSKAYIYLFFFSLIQPLRILKYVYLDNKKITVSDIMESYLCIYRGIKDGKKYRHKKRPILGG